MQVSEETQVVVEAVPQAETKVEVESPVVNPTEQKARDQGWVSKEEWVEGGGNAEDWRTAKEFVERGEIYKSLHEVKRELKKERTAREALQRHQQYIFERAHQTALRDLQQQRRQALRNEDIDKVEAIEAEIDKTKEQFQKEKVQLVQEQQVANTTAVNTEYEAFTARNPWYQTDEEMTDAADGAAFVYLNKGGDRTKLLQHVERVMKQKFPEKFGVRKAAPNPTASTNRTARPGKADDFQLDELETQIMKSLVDAGEMTKAEYVAQLKKAKGIK